MLIHNEYQASATRYDGAVYNRCGRSGLKLPAVSLGLWHNFGSKDNYDNMKQMLFILIRRKLRRFFIVMKRKKRKRRHSILTIYYYMN